MLSLAALCREKKWNFHYYVKTLPKVIDEGNFTQAIDLGMKVFEVSQEEYSDKIAALSCENSSDVLVVPQGGAAPYASEGVQMLAEEIVAFQSEKYMKKLNVVIPSGTGTTAYFLAKHLPTSVTVYTTACVGNREYLYEQMHLLGEIPKNLSILETEKKFHFAKPYREFYAIHKKLLLEDIEFDLIYAPKTFIALQENLKNIEGEILYVHSGGVIGNESMLKRYRYKKLI